MKPSKKAPIIEKLLEIVSGRTTAINQARCVPKPIGCGSAIQLADFRDATSRKEYTISGLCQSCQDTVFKNV